MVVLLTFGCKFFWSPTWPERVGKLSDGKDPFAIEPLSLFRGQAGQQAEVLFLNRFLSASDLEFALAAVSVENEVGGRLTGEQLAYLPNHFSYLARKRGSFHGYTGMIVPMDDLTKINRAAHHFR